MQEQLLLGGLEALGPGEDVERPRELAAVDAQDGGLFAAAFLLHGQGRYDGHAHARQHALLDGLRAVQLQMDVEGRGVEAALLERHLHDFSRARSLFAGDEPLGGQLVERDADPLAPRVVDGHHDHQLVVPEVLDHQVGVVGDGPLDQAQVQLLLQDILGDDGRVGNDHVEPRIAVAGLEGGKQVGHQVLADGEGGPQMHAAHLPLAVVQDGIPRLVHGLDHVGDVLVEHLPALGERHAPVRACEQLGPVLLLEVLYLDADAGLADMQVFGRLGDVAEIGNLLENDELLQRTHVSPLLDPPPSF